MKIFKQQAGFSAFELVLVMVILALVGTVGVLVYNNGHKKAATVSAPAVASSMKLATYTIDNENLVFDYDSSTSAVKQISAGKSPDGTLYVVRTEVTTGSTKLVIKTGVSGIGGLPSCYGDRNTCAVINTKQSSYLGKPITYRLVEGHVILNCGSAGYPSCDKAPPSTIYFVDTGVSREVFGDCCSTVASDSRNLGKKATVAGSTLINIEPSKAVTNADLLKNPDVLKTIKIIESMHY